MVNDAEVADVAVEVESVDGRRAIGWGSMPMGNTWAWPSDQVDGAGTLAAMMSLGQRVVESASVSGLSGHPLEITHELAGGYADLSLQVETELGCPQSMPVLAQLVATSPLEAAVFDAYGKIHNANSYDLLGKPFIDRDLSEYLGPDFSGEYLDQYTLRRPKDHMPLYPLVGALDPLTDAEVENPIADGLPESLAQWIKADGLTHLKIKLSGDDLDWDVARVMGIEQVAAEVQGGLGIDQWCYSADFNEKCANVEYVLDFLHKVREQAPAAFDRIQYLEQPTHRDLKAHPENRMHAAAKVKPVVIDESLVDYDSLQLSRELGYTGVALKACKGHHEALLMGAAAQKHGLFLCVQDLTCIGYSFLHSTSLAARIPTVSAIEGNGRQYCPAGNDLWEPTYPGMFQISNGTVRSAELIGPGLFGCNDATAYQLTAIDRRLDV